MLHPAGHSTPLIHLVPSILILFMPSLRFFSTLFLCLSFSLMQPAQAATSEHPCAGLVKKYLTCVVNQNWESAAVLLQPSALARKQKEAVSVMKSATTMSAEQEMLNSFGVKEIRDLEALTPQAFYVLDRISWHKRVNTPAEVSKRKQETLKVDVLGVAEEKDRGYAHVTVRTTQETLTDRVEELFLISFIKEKDKWLISPDLKDRPIITPLKEPVAAKPAQE
jgi:hypothetical protein